MIYTTTCIKYTKNNEIIKQCFKIVKLRDMSYKTRLIFINEATGRGYVTLYVAIEVAMLSCLDD